MFKAWGGLCHGGGTITVFDFAHYLVSGKVVSIRLHCGLFAQL